ncbi:MAG: hypothetical protein FWF18_01445 [Dehalococcoidia bacterium]|nr:hypothetical protein [Dehalococcoidia bacterium]
MIIGGSFAQVHPSPKLVGLFWQVVIIRLAQSQNYKTLSIDAVYFTVDCVAEFSQIPLCCRRTDVKSFSATIYGSFVCDKAVFLQPCE